MFNPISFFKAARKEAQRIAKLADALPPHTPTTLKELNDFLNAEFLKNHAGKPMLSLLPWKEIEQVALVADHGAEKYSRDNWKKGTPEDYLSAALRHVSARAQGNQTDESSHPHLAHAVCSLLFVMWMDNKRVKQPKKQGIRVGWGEPTGYQPLTGEGAPSNPPNQDSGGQQPPKTDYYSVRR